MKIDEIKLLYGYNEWADARILTACAKVSAEQYAAPMNIGSGRGGLRETMVHILDSMWQDRITLQGFYNEPLENEAAYDATELHEDAFPTFEALRERWMIEQREMRACLDTLTDEMLDSTMRYVIPGIVRERVMWQFIMAAVLHLRQHRGEAGSLLTLHGQSPGDLEFTMFLDERASGKS